MKNIIKAVVFFIIFLCILSGLNKVFSPIGSSEGAWYVAGALRDMYKQGKNTIDVLYLGDSNVYSGISPFEIYDRIGVTGYSASAPGQDPIGSYYAAKEFFKTQSPQIVFLETSEFFTAREYFSELSIRSEIDYMNFGINKLNIINEKYLDFSLNDKLSFIFPIVRFHDRYSRLTEFDVRKGIQKTEMSYKGYLYENTINKYENKGQKNYEKFMEQKKKGKKIELENTDLKILDYAIEKVDLLNELCKKNNCELILITMPNTDESSLEKYEVVKKFAEEKGLKYFNVNFEVDEPINWETDTQDKGYHLNIKGAEKVGEYLSKYLKDNFNIESKKEKTEYKQWNQSLESYKQRKLEGYVNL